MALYTIGDTHLSLGSDKPMDVFGGAWEGYVEKLAQGLSVLRPEDTLVIAGDISWGMSLEESEADFAWLDALPGRKILMKGNHDYWWNTAAKMTRFFAEKGFSTLHILHNNCHFYGDLALCGTRVGSMRRRSRGRMKRCFAGSWPGWRPRSRPPGPGRSSAFFITPLFTRGTAAPPSWSCWSGTR